MPEILSFGSRTKTGKFRLLVQEIFNLSLFTKFVILTAIILALVAPYIVRDVQTIVSNAAPVSQSGAGLPANCHLAVDLSSCAPHATCQPTPSVVCDSQ